MAPHLTKDNRKNLAHIILKLKAMFPTAHPVRIKTVKKTKGKQNFGYIQLIDTDKKNPYFLINLLRTEYEIMLDSLIHEYGHAMSWKLAYNEHTEVEFHDESWAIEYSKLYRLFIDPGVENPRYQK